MDLLGCCTSSQKFTLVFAYCCVEFNASSYIQVFFYQLEYLLFLLSQLSARQGWHTGGEQGIHWFLIKLGKINCSWQYPRELHVLLAKNNYGSKTANTVCSKSNRKTVVASYESLFITNVPETRPYFMQWFSICTLRGQWFQWFMSLYSSPYKPFLFYRRFTVCTT